MFDLVCSGWACSFSGRVTRPRRPIEIVGRVLFEVAHVWRSGVLAERTLPRQRHFYVIRQKITRDSFTGRFNETRRTD